MIPTLIASVLVVLTFCAYVARTQIVRNAPLPDPATDWWPKFERQYREHVAKVAQQRPIRRITERH